MAWSGGGGAGWRFFGALWTRQCLPPSCSVPCPRLSPHRGVTVQGRRGSLWNADPFGRFINPATLHRSKDEAPDSQRSAGQGVPRRQNSLEPAPAWKAGASILRRTADSEVVCGASAGSRLSHAAMLSMSLVRPACLQTWLAGCHHTWPLACLCLPACCLGTSAPSGWRADALAALAAPVHTLCGGGDSNGLPSGKQHGRLLPHKFACDAHPPWPGDLGRAVWSTAPRKASTGGYPCGDTARSCWARTGDWGLGIGRPAALLKKEQPASCPSHSRLAPFAPPVFMPDHRFCY